MQDRRTGNITPAQANAACLQLLRHADVRADDQS